MSEQMALPGAEAAAKQQAARLSRVPAGLAHPLKQRGELILSGRLAGAKHGDGVPAGHAGPQRLHGPAAGNKLIGHRDGHDTASSRTSSRTSAAYGFARRRSLTSSATLSCSAV